MTDNKTGIELMVGIARPSRLNKHDCVQITLNAANLPVALATNTADVVSDSMALITCATIAGCFNGTFCWDIAVSSWCGSWQVKATLKALWMRLQMCCAIVAGWHAAVSGLSMWSLWLWMLKIRLRLNWFQQLRIS